jgi:hypothetical protein
MKRKSRTRAKSPKVARSTDAGERYRSYGRGHLATLEAALRRFVQFANFELNVLSNRKRQTLKDELVFFAPHTPRVLESELQLSPIQQQVREILTPLAKRELCVPPDETAIDRSSLLGDEPTHFLAHTDDLVLSFQWERVDDSLGEHTLSVDFRSSVLFRLREALMAHRENFRLSRCRAPLPDGPCGKFFWRTKGQKYCSARCLNRAKYIQKKLDG